MSTGRTHPPRHRPTARLAFPAVALLAAACAAGPTAPGDVEGLPRDLTPQERAAADAGNDFAWRLFGRVAAEEPGENVFLSPLSASMALTMTMNGADGETLEAMRRTLGVSGLELDEVNRAYRDLIALFFGLDPRVRAEIGNAIWYREGFPVREEFADTNRDFFRAEVAPLDFASPEALATINGWAAEKTNGRIPTILDAIDPAWFLILMNAIYFKAPWTKEFDPDRTREGPFRLADGTTRPVPFMSHQEERFAAYFGDAYSAIELPYGVGAFTMVVVVPNGDRTLEQLVAAMDAAEWSRLTANLGGSTAPVLLPRFELEYERNLVDDLIDLGMGIAFTPEADFGRMSEAPFWIDLVKQKTFVKVDEEGTEAAAVTVVTGPTSAPAVVAADRPFLFVIRERFSGTILFVGQVVDPTE